MNICVFGASGQTGKSVIRQALNLGYSILAAVRNPESFDQATEKLQVLRCDVLEDASLQSIDFSDVDHVVVALGTKDLWGNKVRSIGTQNIVRAMKASGSSARLWVISAAGVGSSSTQLSWFNRLIANVLLPSVMKEHEAQEKTVMNSGLSYSILRPSGLTNIETDKPSQLVASGKIPTSTIARQQIANCILTHLDDESLVNKAICITGS